MNAQSALGAYKALKNQKALDDASPHQLIELMLSGALERVISAMGSMERNETAEAGESIGKAISIVDNLRVSLDAEKGGEMAENLQQLYDYITRRLLEASVSQQPELLSEVAGLLKQIKAAWDQIPTEFHHLGDA
jgi:flagellar secretion chaperone FliS